MISRGRIKKINKFDPYHEFGYNGFYDWFQFSSQPQFSKRERQEHGEKYFKKIEERNMEQEVAGK